MSYKIFRAPERPPAGCGDQFLLSSTLLRFGFKFGLETTTSTHVHTHFEVRHCIKQQHTHTDLGCLSQSIIEGVLHTHCNTRVETA